MGPFWNMLKAETPVPLGDCTQRETALAPWMLRRPCKARIAAPGEVAAQQATQTWVGGTWCGTQWVDSLRK